MNFLGREHVPSDPIGDRLQYESTPKLDPAPKYSCVLISLTELVRGRSRSALIHIEMASQIQPYAQIIVRPTGFSSD
jgi:hypothetical protein